MGLLLVIALIFTTGNFVEVSATDKTICDVMPNNKTCNQDPCDQPPCSLQCNQSYDGCSQNCNATTCNTLACSSSETCVQSCDGGYCNEFRCNAKYCVQSCIKGGDCTTMRCTNSMPGSTCMHGGNTKELFCDSESCQQDCFDDCNMTCSSSVKTCSQTCHNGTCFYQCDAQTCRVDCLGGNCPQLKSSTTLTPATSKIPSVGIRYYVAISLVSGLLLAVVVFIWIMTSFFMYNQNNRRQNLMVETLCPKGPLWRFANLKKRNNKAFPSPPLPQMMRRGKGCGPFEDIVSTILSSIVP